MSAYPVKRYFRRDFSGTKADHMREYGSTVYDVIWYDRTTGEVVLRYDGADPANREEGDDWTLYRKGHNTDERVEETQCVVKHGEENAHHEAWCLNRYGE